MRGALLKFSPPVVQTLFPCYEWWCCTEEQLSRYSQLLIKELGCGVMQSAIDPELLMLSKTNKRERRSHRMRTLAILDEAVSRADVVSSPSHSRTSLKR